jgi:hypothetical protein
VLVNGEPVAAPSGRADDFTLRRDKDGQTAAPASVPAAAMAAVPPEAARAEPATAPDKKPPPPKSGPKGKTTQNAPKNPPKPKSLRPPREDDVPRPPAPVYRSGGGLFGTFR